MPPEPGPPAQHGDGGGDRPEDAAAVAAALAQGQPHAGQLADPALQAGHLAAPNSAGELSNQPGLALPIPRLIEPTSNLWARAPVEEREAHLIKTDEAYHDLLKDFAVLADSYGQLSDDSRRRHRRWRVALIICAGTLAATNIVATQDWTKRMTASSTPDSMRTPRGGRFSYAADSSMQNPSRYPRIAHALTETAPQVIDRKFSPRPVVT